MRIQLRSSVLNSVRVFNISKLTRLVVDHKWDKKVWEKSWEMRNRQDLIEKSLGEEGQEMQIFSKSREKEESWVRRKEQVGDRRS